MSAYASRSDFYCGDRHATLAMTVILYVKSSSNQHFFYFFKRIAVIDDGFYFVLAEYKVNRLISELNRFFLFRFGVILKAHYVSVYLPCPFKSYERYISVIARNGKAVIVFFVNRRENVKRVRLFDESVCVFFKFVFFRRS